jgi:hypothetical protein
VPQAQRERERNGGVSDSRCEIAWSVTRLGDEDAVPEDESAC